MPPKKPPRPPARNHRAPRRGPRCTVCTHEGRAAIDRALIGGESAPKVAAKYRGLTDDAVRRHASSHLPEHLAAAAEVRSVVSATQTLEQIDRCLERVNLLFDACDRWLRDPDDPSRYEVGPRAENVKVVYLERGEDGKMTRKKATIAELLERVAGVAPEIRLVEIKHSDPRELVLQASKRLEGLSELLARIRGELPEPTVAVLVSPAWLELRSRILGALEPYPKARQAVAAALVAHAG